MEVDIASALLVYGPLGIWALLSGFVIRALYKQVQELNKRLNDQQQESMQTIMDFADKVHEALSIAEKISRRRNGNGS